MLSFMILLMKRKHVDSDHAKYVCPICLELNGIIIKFILIIIGLEYNLYDTQIEHEDILLWNI